MRFCLGLLFAVVTVFTMAGRSDAELIVSVDLDSVTPGIQSTNLVPLIAGQQITATFYLEQTSAADALAVYNFDVHYGDGLTAIGRTETSWAAGWTADFDTNNTNTVGVAGRYDGFTNDANGQASVVAPTAVGTLILQVTGAGATFVTPGIFDSPFNDFVDANFNSVTPTFNSGTVNVAAVPEPTSMAVLAVAGIGGWVARRRGARKQAVK